DVSDIAKVAHNRSLGTHRSRPGSPMTAEPWWKRAFRTLRRADGGAADGVRSTADHHYLELVPDQLSAHIHRHDVPNGFESIPCWSYVSEGLMRFGQPGIVFTLVRTRREAAAPPEPIHLFRMIRDFAEAGQIVGAGGVTQFGDGKFFGRHLTYIRSQPLPG